MLIVDNHEVSRAALGALLRTEGFDVIDVTAGNEAITAARSFRPGMALIDVTPGSALGLAVASQLRRLADAPVVLLTSSSGRSRFGAELDGYPLLAKADVCGQAIISLAAAWRSATRGR